MHAALEASYRPSSPSQEDPSLPRDDFQMHAALELTYRPSSPSQPVITSDPDPAARPVRDEGLTKEEEWHEVVDAYCVSSSGYLVVEAGAWVTVRFWQGADAFEAAGWCYAFVLGDEARQGWLPQRVLARRV